MSEPKFYVERFSGNDSHVHELPGASHVGVLLANGDAIELTQPYSTDDYAEVRTCRDRLVLKPAASNIVVVTSEGGWDTGIAARMRGPEDAEAALVDALRSCDELERLAAALARNASTVVTKNDRQDRADEIRLFTRLVRKALRSDEEEPRRTVVPRGRTSTRQTPRPGRR